MRSISTYFGVGLLAVGVMLADQRDAEAQYPYTINGGASYVAPVQAYAPAVVGYTAERRGLFGRRTVYRPVLGPSVAQPIAVVAPVETITQATAFAPVPITAARPVLQPTAVYQSPLAAAPVVVSQRVVTSGPVVMGRPVVNAQSPVIMGTAPVIMGPAPVIMGSAPVVVGRPMLAPTVVNRPVVVTRPAVINSYYPPVYPTPFAPVVGY
jgi:hypothetical protein